MFDIEELANEQEYNDIKEDITSECGKYGGLQQVILPRANEVNAGKVYLLYNTADAAAKIFKEVHGRAFGDKTVVADYENEGNWTFPTSAA